MLLVNCKVASLPLSWTWWFNFWSVLSLCYDLCCSSRNSLWKSSSRGWRPPEQHVPVPHAFSVPDNIIYVWRGNGLAFQLVLHSSQAPKYWGNPWLPLSTACSFRYTKRQRCWWETWGLSMAYHALRRLLLRGAALHSARSNFCSKSFTCCPVIPAQIGSECAESCGAAASIKEKQLKVKPDLLLPLFLFLCRLHTILGRNEEKIKTKANAFGVLLPCQYRSCLKEGKHAVQMPFLSVVRLD